MRLRHCSSDKEPTWVWGVLKTNHTGSEQQPVNISRDENVVPYSRLSDNKKKGDLPLADRDTSGKTNH